MKRKSLPTSRAAGIFLLQPVDAANSTETRNSFSSSRGWTMIKIPPFESLFLAVECSSIGVSSISARNVFEERRCGAIWKIGAFSFQGGAENRLNIGGGRGNPHFLQGPWPSNKSWYRKQPLLVPNHGQYLYPALACFTLRVARGHFEVDRSTKLNVTVVPRVIYLASHNHQEREASKPDYSKCPPTL